MRIAMIGTGYVGLVSGACIADFGHRVTCVDRDSAKICALNSGEIPIYEPGLKDIVQANVREGRLHFTKVLSEAVVEADAVFIRCLHEHNTQHLTEIKGSTGIQPEARGEEEHLPCLWP
jgi:UDP-glucose 6-dehydrogenase